MKHPSSLQKAGEPLVNSRLWKRGRAVECTGLENRRRGDPSVSSNLTASARRYARISFQGDQVIYIPSSMPLEMRLDAQFLSKFEA